MNKQYTSSRPRLQRRQLGVTLIEALVALMIMGFGMVALVELMGNLRRSGDLGKQRSEAMRLAQAEMATLRAFSVVAKASDAASGVIDYETHIVSAESRSVTPDDSNTTYTLTRAVAPLDAASEPGARTVHVTVTWEDRGGRKGAEAEDTRQSVALSTVIARVEPAFSGAVGFTPPPGGTRQPGGRHPTIPTAAKDLGHNMSAHRPSTLSGMVWVFNNVTGVITGKCTIDPSTPVTSLTAVDVESCKNNTVGYLLSGTVRFSNTTPANPTLPEANAINLDMAIVSSNYLTPDTDTLGRPRKDAAGDYIMKELTATAPSHECFDNAPTSPLIIQQFVNYDCIVYPTDTSPRIWSGKLTVVPVGFSIGMLATEYRVCRYTADYNGNRSPYVSATVAYDNFEHPEVYVGVTGSLARQNFLVVKGTSTCPTAPAVEPARGIFVDFSTKQLQPSP
ncbi:prepilin-type N-terminal cleavage/methylation domain-containing protein [Roseateles asaccharophilus]|uniref:Tfp pilus assembly protein PilV n=1 Tax=Roseateles asaccharophilus TaxID=582607 RepID=A0ABU2A691_9BURK|nr:prepilin-type N-terminal cleavage/methylation domain-containing protein [Roseateles asaccharophilus]MDR7332525.1 Tfp pilus assembly protein PilV [Roseateles asaccharophilus]